MFGSQNRPEVQFEQEIRGRGILRSEGEELRVSDFVVRRLKYGSGSGWNVRAYLDADYSGREAVLAQPEPPSFVGESDRGQAVRIDELYVDRRQEHRIRGTCYELEMGPEDLPAPPDRQYVSISFSDTSVAQPEVLFPLATHKGELKADNGTDVEPFRIPTRLGEGKFSLKFEWENATVAGNKASVRVPQPTLRLIVDDEDTEDQPLKLLDILGDDLRWLERLLAFLSRKHVSWSHLYVLSRWEEDAPVGPPPETGRWRTGVSGDTATEVVHRPMIAPGRMDPDDLGGLLEEMRQLDYSEFVYHSIGHLIGGISERFVEGQMMNAFTALEAVVSGWCREHDREFIVDPAPHNEIRAAMRDELREAVREHHGVPSGRWEEVYDALRRKMTESHTRRRSFADRARDTVEGSGAEWTDLWPEGVELRKAISAAYGRRSQLIHEGRRPDDPPSWVDIFRMHALTERVIYNLIDGDDDWLHPAAYNHCARLRGVEP